MDRPISKFELLSSIIEKTNSITEYALCERPILYWGYSYRFFEDILMKEFDSIIEHIKKYGEDNIKIIYYEDMVTDFWKYLQDMNTILRTTEDKLRLIYEDLKNSFHTDNKRRITVFPGRHKSDLDPDFNERFNKLYEKYPFLHRYIEG